MSIKKYYSKSKKIVKQKYKTIKSKKNTKNTKKSKKSKKNNNQKSNNHKNNKIMNMLGGFIGCAAADEVPNSSKYSINSLKQCLEKGTSGSVAADYTYLFSRLKLT